MAVSKVVKSNGDVIMDISQDNVNPNNLLQGGTAHGSDGEEVQGAVIVAPTDVTEVSDTTPYLYKSSEHDAVYDELVGSSVAWNQLVQNGNFESTSGWATSGGTMTTLSTANNILTISSTASINTSDVRLQQTINLVDSHKYLFTVTGYSSAAHNHQRDGGIEIYPMNINVITIVFSTTKQTYYKVFNTAAGSTIVSQIRLYSMDSITSHISNLFCIDLTQMFGSTIADYVYNLEQSTAGSGIAWLKSYGFITKEYYPYNAGGLISVNTSGKKVVGKNLLALTTSTLTTYSVTYIGDSETGIVTATGTATATSGGAQFSIPIPAELVGNYYFSALTSTGSDSTYDAYVWCLTDGARAKKWNGTTNSSSDYGNGNVEIRLEAEKTYVLNLRVKNGITVNNLVFKPMIRRADTDSTFEPYTSLTYPIQSTDLRGLYKLNGNKLYTDGDIYSADGTVTRKYGYRDYQSGDESLANAITDGTHTIYKLSAPTTETASSYTSPQMVYRNGTEEYLDTRDVPIPVGGNRKYIDIPDWMVNEYFDDVRAEASTISEVKKELHDFEEHLEAFIIKSSFTNPSTITNTSDFTDELFDKYWGSNTDLYPRFAHLYLSGNTRVFLKAIISSVISNNSIKMIKATFLYSTRMYDFTWIYGQVPSMSEYTIQVVSPT